MAEPVQDSLFREIDEELRQEHYAKLWKRYGGVLIAAAVLLVVGVAGYQGWRHYDLSSRQESANLFAGAMRAAEAKKTDEALQAFAGIAEDGAGGYPLLARFQEASILAKSGKKKAAAAAYAELAEDSGTDAVYRDLASLLSVLNEMDSGQPSQLTSRLAPLSADDNPWRHGAREIMGILAFRSGDATKARELFTGIKDDATAPQGIRRRATEMLAVIGK